VAFHTRADYAQQLLTDEESVSNGHREMVCCSRHPPHGGLVLFLFQILAQCVPAAGAPGDSSSRKIYNAGARSLIMHHALGAVCRHGARSDRDFSCCSDSAPKRVGQRCSARLLKEWDP